MPPAETPNPSAAATPETLPGLLFTAFEPSGDDHAAAVIAELKRRLPTLPIYAWGGAHMEAAGATIVERTGDDAVMGLPGLAKIREHRRINRRIREWMRATPGIKLHVPVDSPAANFPICRIARKQGIGILHLVAPQVWAWGGWRIRKLRRLTDMLLCLLPFEEPWFKERGIPARFVGHPLFDTPIDREALATQAAGFGQGSPRVALLPGSRPAEIARNFPLLLETYRQIAGAEPESRGVVAATTAAVAERIRSLAARHGGWPESLEVAVRQTDAVIHWSDLALVVSGTVTLQIARQQRPMIIVYKSSPLLYMLLARWVLSTEFLTLPNLVAGREIVPEFVPHFGGHEPIAAEALKIIRSPETASRQRAELARITEQFDGHHAGAEAAEAILLHLGIGAAAMS
ncbi:MAG: lipid-A-disaccharide synthase [Phycisphaerales bacterium]|nr:lipid-A-disaccharide synthase [Phycisphaerales bacterium]